MQRVFRDSLVTRRGAAVLLLGCGRIARSFDRGQTPLPKTPPESLGALDAGDSIDGAIRGTLDILTTEMPLTDAELQRARAIRHVELLHFATAVTAVVPCYNVAGVATSLNFTPEVLAGIFLERIRKWNDPVLRALNPAAHLPAADIVVVGHAYEDASTYLLSDFLSKTDVDWQHRIGIVRSISGQPVLAAGHSPEETAQLLKATPGSISYLELWTAQTAGLRFGRIRNASGRLIEASPSSVAAAAATAVPRNDRDFRVSITNPSEPIAYPVAGFIWIVIPEKLSTPAKMADAITFLKWVLTDGQRSTEMMHFVPMPRAFTESELRFLDSIR